MLRLKGTLPVSFFSLEVDIEFKNTGDVEFFLDWSNKVSKIYPAQRAK